MLGRPPGAEPAHELVERVGNELNSRFRAYVEMLADTGRIPVLERFKPLTDGKKPTVWEIKVHWGPGYRFFCLRHRQRWIVTHGVAKPKNNKAYKPEIAKARTIFSDWIERQE